MSDTVGKPASTHIPIYAAVIGALATIAASLLAAYFQSKSTSEDTAKVVVAASIVPIGTVVASVLVPSEFYRQAQIKGGPFDAEKYTWVLADGRDVTRSQYEKLLRVRNVPDLRGLFLRGLNAERADGKEGPDATMRIGGDYQQDMVGKHGHSLAPRIAALSVKAAYGGLTEYAVGADATLGAAVSAGDSPGVETRPRNSGVYWYMRIN